MSNAKPAPTQEPHLTMTEVAKVLNVSRPTIYRLINHDPTFVTHLVGGSRRMRPSALAAWIKKQEEKERAA